jgi:hypothetical protein
MASRVAVEGLATFVTQLKQLCFKCAWFDSWRAKPRRPLIIGIKYGWWRCCPSTNQDSLAACGIDQTINQRVTAQLWRHSFDRLRQAKHILEERQRSGNIYNIADGVTNVGYAICFGILTRITHRQHFPLVTIRLIPVDDTAATLNINVKIDRSVATRCIAYPERSRRATQPS